MGKHGKSIWNEWITYVIIVVAIILVGGIVVLCTRNGETKNEFTMLGKEIKLTNSMKQELYDRVKKDITDSLKSPSSAVFPEIKDWNIRVNTDNVIEVKSYVDSQNSYGAMLRADFEQKYILLNKDKYLCVYKEFNNETEFDITERTQYKEFINENVYDFQMEKFIEKSKNATIYGKLKDYNYDYEQQNLELNIEILKIDSQYYKIENYINGVIAAYIDQCICIPTVTTNLNIYSEKECIATVKNINLEFLLKDWYILWDLGIMSNTDGTNLEDKLKDRLWIKSEDKQSINNNLDKTKKTNQTTKNYITEFTSNTSKKGFTEAETTKKFIEMMKWCSQDDIYNELFSQDLKKKN